LIIQFKHANKIISFTNFLQHKKNKNKSHENKTLICNGNNVLNSILYNSNKVNEENYQNLDKKKSQIQYKHSINIIYKRI